MIRALLWDIDGTLLTTRRAGIAAWEQAAREACGHPVDLDAFPTSGLTDFEVGRRILVHLGVPADLPAVAAVTGRYEELLPDCLGGRVGSVLPNVREILGVVAGMPIRSFLLTGNTRRGAAAKLAHYDLAAFFGGGGGFGDDRYSRDHIAVDALAVARAALPDLAEHETLVIGDTPHDVSCGRHIGARVLAVATGTHSTTELQACGPWWTVPELPAPPAFLDRILQPWPEGACSD